MFEKEKFKCPVLTQVIKDYNRRAAKKIENFKPRNTSPSFKGLKLGKSALRNVFYRNAVRVFPKLAISFTSKELGPQLITELQKMHNPKNGAAKGERVNKQRVIKAAPAASGKGKSYGSRSLKNPRMKFRNKTKTKPRKGEIFKPLLSPGLRKKAAGKKSR